MKGNHQVVRGFVVCENFTFTSREYSRHNTAIGKNTDRNVDA